MAGIGSAWGSREEMLHPRDRHGRFRKKWKMAASVVDALSGFLDRFQPRQFQSDQQASQYSFNHRKSPWSGVEERRLHSDWDDANEALQAGEMDDTTKKFVAMMDRNMTLTEDDLIVSLTVPTTAFGLTPQQANLEDGGLEDLIGLEIGDAGYVAANIGSELSHPPGSVTLRVAVPKGTRVAYGGRSPDDRALFFDRDQPLVVTKVESDGRGGWYMLAIAGSGKRTKGATAVADDRTHGRRGGGLTPQQREARVTPQMSGEERLRIAQQNEREMQTGPSTVTPAPGATQTPAPAAPASPQTPAPPAAGVPERREPVHSPAIGPGSPEGKSASDIAAQADEAKVQAENAPPAPPATPTPLEFQEAARSLPIPTSGPQRNEWNRAHRDLAQGRRDPGDVLRELDTDIQENKRQAASATHAEKKDTLERNIQAQEQLADLIAEKYGVQRQGTSAPVARKAPAATPGAPSTKREATPKAPAPKKAAKRAPADIGKQVMGSGTREEADSHLEGLTGAELKAVADDLGAPIRARATKAEMRKAIVQKRGRQLDSDAISGQGAARRAAEAEAATKKAAPAVPAPVAKKAVPEAPTAPVKKATGGVITEDYREERAAREKVTEAQDNLRKAEERMGRIEFDTPEHNDAEEDVQRLRGERDDAEDALKATRERITAKKAAPAPSAPAKAAPAKAVAKKAVPAKAAPSPVDAEEEAFKARVAEAGLPDKVADLKAQAREKKIRGFSTMNKKQLQSALLGDEVPRAGKIAPVTPAKLVPHLKAAESDQEARKLLENHTLADLKALAKDRELEIPKRGATKDRLKDDILANVRGVPEGAGGETPSRSLRQELDAQKWVEPSDPATAKGVRGVIADTNDDDPAELRIARDELEELAQRRRAEGNRNDANLIQTLADTMGMRAQVISGVEEGPARAPSKRAVKKAVPEVSAPEAPKTLDKMLRPELAQVAADEGVDVKKSATKAQLREAIERDRRVKAARAEGAPNLGGQRDRAPTVEEIARDAGIEGDAGGIVTEADARLKQDGPEAAADYLRREAARVEAEVPQRRARTQTRSVPIPGEADQVEANDRENARKLRQAAERVSPSPRALKRVPEGSVAGPRTDQPITAPSRRDSFTEAFDQQGFQAPGAAGRSLTEVRDDIATGKITPEEGVRRIESDIAFNKDEIADIEATLRGDSVESLAEKMRLQQSKKDLRESIKAQEKASKFVRTHFKEEAPITQKELEVQLDGPEKAALDRVTPDSLKEAARQEGLGDIEGDDKDTVIQNIAKAVAARELKDRAAKKAAPAAVPEAPAAPKKAAKFLPPLASGQQRKSATNVEVGDIVQRAGARNAPPARVVKVERGPGGIDITLEDGRKYNNNPNSAYWMGKDVPSAPEAPAPAKKVSKKAAQAARDEEAVSGLRTLAEGGNLEGPISGAPAKRAAKAAVPAKATPPPVVDLDNPTRHNAEVIGTGLDLEPKGADRDWLGIVQRDLDRGTDGRQIANDLRREADSQRTIHNIQEAIAPGTGGPAGRIDRMERMADRLEGVRPIEAPAPAKAAPSGPDKREMGTMSAATAQSKALFDLRNGKSHAEVATALRQAATSVGSREHDPQTVRPLEFTPAERSAMKRSDAKKLRELAAEIQAQGVAQRTAAKAAKKAPAKKAAPATPDDDRKNLTGPIGEVIKAQLDDTMRRLQEADSPAAEDSALAGLLAPELRQLATRLGLDSKGSKATLLQRIKDRAKGREAPGASAERAVPKAEAPGGLTTQPPKPHEWGNLQGQKPGGHYFHPDGQIPMAMDRLGADAQIDVGGGESLHNAMGDVATDLVMGRITGDEAVARIGALYDKLPAGSDARRKVAALAESLDRPAVAMPRIPEDTPAPVRKLIQQMMKFPIARTKGRYGGSSYETSLIDKVKAFLDEKASGNSSLVGMSRDLAQLIQGHTHESQEGSMGLGALSRPLFDDNSEISKALQQWAKDIRARRR